MIDVEPGARRRGGVLAVLLVALVPALRAHLRRRPPLPRPSGQAGRRMAQARRGRSRRAAGGRRRGLPDGDDLHAREPGAASAAGRSAHPREPAERGARAARLAARHASRPTAPSTWSSRGWRRARTTSPSAAHYFDTAINGTWDDDAEDRRRAVRLEFATWLLGRGETARAQSQLIALTADLPVDSSLRTDVARLLLQAGSPSRALEQFRDVLGQTPDDAEALTGAGLAALQVADYAAARALPRRRRRGEGPLDAAGAGGARDGDQRPRSRIRSRAASRRPSAAAARARRSRSPGRD